jgi:hypothetical protein
MQPLHPSSRPTLLGQSPWPISHATGVRIMRGMSAVSCTFKQHRQGRFSAHFRINQQSHGFLDAGAELTRLYPVCISSTSNHAA